MNYYSVKISYEKEIEFQNLKRIVENYVVKAENADINSDYMAQLTGLNLVSIESINKINISDVLFFDGDKYFVVKLKFLVENDDTKAIRKITEQFIVRSENLENAVINFKEKVCKNTLSENFVTSVRELNIVDVLPY